MKWPLFRYVLMAAMRDKLLLSIVALVAVTVSLSNFFATSVVIEQVEFARVFTAYGFRLFGTAILVMFVVSHIRRGFDSREIDFLLSRPIGRVSFVLSHAAAFSFIAVVLAFILGLVLVLQETANLHEGVWLWWLSLAVEFIIMANVAMFFSLVITSTTASLAIVFCFYLLSRLMGEILGILQNKADGAWSGFLARIMEFISIFIPRLDLMGQTKWLVYGVPDTISLPFIIAQCAVFLSLIVGAAVMDMHKRQF
ncbi:MAG: hypothetical protein WC989_03450 [Micavibrio sp.]